MSLRADMNEKEAPYGYGLVKHGIGTLWLVEVDRRGVTIWDWGDDPALRYRTWLEASKVRRRIQKRHPPGDEQIIIVPIPQRRAPFAIKTNQKESAK